MLYIICESSPPYLVHAWILAKEEAITLLPEYNAAIEECWKWKQAGKPNKGYRETKIVNRYGREV